MTIHSVWTYPTTVAIGPGTIGELGTFCRRSGARRPLIVTDPGVADLPFLTQARCALVARFAQAAVFSQLHGNPTLAQARAGAAFFDQGQFDLLVAIGGGSAIDAAKGIALCAGDPRRIAAFEWDRVLRDYPLPTDFPRLEMPAIIAVPTTAGTGSELGRDTVLVDDQGVKRVFTHPQLLPYAVILDPCLTVGLPPALTAATGMDALTHHLEAFFSPLDHPLSDGVALEGLRLIRDNLETAFHKGTDLAAREAMLKASALGAVAFQKGLGAAHAIAHVLGARHGLHHGLLNAMLLPYVLCANAPAIRDRARLVTRHLELAGPPLEALLSWLLRLRQALQIPHQLSELGLNGDDAEQVGAAAAAEHSSADTNPLPLDAAGYAAIYRNAISGRLTLPDLNPSGSPASPR